MKICWKYWQQLRKMVLILSSFGIYFVDNAWRCLYDDYHDCKVNRGDQKTDRNNDLLRCWDVKESFRIIIRRFNSHHSTLAGNLDFLLFLSPFCPNSGFWMLVDNKLGSCVVEQSFFENIRRFESHHSAIGFTSSDLLSWRMLNCQLRSGDTQSYISQGFVVDGRLRCCVVEKSFFRNIRRFEPHHSALAEIFGFSGFHV